MATAPTLILHNGGLRSLVATAAALTEHKAPFTHLLHLRDTRPSATRRLEYVRRQAKHFNIRHIRILDLPAIPVSGAETDSERPERVVKTENAVPVLHRPHVLMIGLACAMEMQAERLIWPCQQPQGDFDSVARVTEQVVLVQALAHQEREQLPAIETPMLELDDRKLLELGDHLAMPWQHAWSCLLGGEAPCRVCNACRHRHMAFQAAGLVDPIEEAVAVR